MAAMQDKNSRVKARKKNQKAKIKAQEQRTQGRYDADLDSAKGLALEDIQKYFSDRGLDPGQYQSDIDRAMQETVMGIPNLAGNIPSYFNNMGENIYGELSNANQTRAMTGLEDLIPQGFENTYIPNTADDAIIQEILGQSRGEADKYVQNLQDRGVVTNAGFQAAQGDVAAQEAKVRALLNQLGGQVLTEGRGQLTDIMNQGKMAASGLRLGQDFDPNTYKAQIDSAFNDITAGLGDSLKALIPEGGLFQTTGLAAKAGAGQGAQNTKFSPNALAGIFEDDEDRQASNLSIF